MVNTQNLVRGLTSRCRPCAAARRSDPEHYRLLNHRTRAMRQRCSVPTSPAYPRYGGRGIEFRFASAREATLWIDANLPGWQGAEIDRIDNNGHYEPGNLRLATRAEQNANRELNVYTTWRGLKLLAYTWAESPFAPNTTVRYAAVGLTGEQIVEQAWAAVIGKRKNWRGIEAKLLAMREERPQTMSVPVVMNGGATGPRSDAWYVVWKGSPVWGRTWRERPFSPHKTRELAAQGLTGEQIIARARSVVRAKSLGWQNALHLMQKSGLMSTTS